MTGLEDEETEMSGNDALPAQAPSVPGGAMALAAALLLAACTPVTPDEPVPPNLELVRLCPNGQPLYRREDGRLLTLYYIGGEPWGVNHTFAPGLTPEEVC